MRLSLESARRNNVAAVTSAPAGLSGLSRSKLEAEVPTLSSPRNADAEPRGHAVRIDCGGRFEVIHRAVEIAAHAGEVAGGDVRFGPQRRYAQSGAAASVGLVE